MVYEIIVSLLTLVGLEIVLGIDNIIFISILAQRLPHEKQKKAIRLGLLIAMVSRLALLMAISLILKLKSDLFTIFGQGISGKDIILILGGLFLLYKSTVEIYHKMEGDEKPSTTRVKSQKLMTVLLQILIMDMVFSLDSIITAIGLVDQIWIMYIAIVIAVGVMMFAAYPISNFVKDHPSFKILALAFLLLIGFSLVSEGFDVEIPKGYIYFAMFFSLMVDLLQMKMSKKQENEDKLQKAEKNKEAENSVVKD